MINRRAFLGASASSLALPIGLGSYLLSAGTSHAQTADYKALVCVFLSGGNDGINMLPPIEQAKYQQYAAVRAGLALPLTGTGAIVPLDANYGLHPGMQALSKAWGDGALAAVFNVGPLAQPLTQAQYLSWRGMNDVSKVPDSLYSHSDQVKLWQNGKSNSLERTGWAARVMDALNDGSTVFSVSGNSTFGTGTLTSSLVLPSNPGSGFGLNGYGTDAKSTTRRAGIDSQIAAIETNILHKVYSGIQKIALDRSAILQPILQQRPTATVADAANPEISAAFSNLQGDFNNGISKQLYQVAKLIKNRAAIGGNRHIFYVSLGGFDTHVNQLSAQGSLLLQLGNAMSAFYAATQALGVSSNVTTFTESDFGRTFKPNSSAGTDHAWGNQHLVMGGAVNGKQFFGTYPSLVLGGADDAGKNTWDSQGRWIPSLAVDQYAATLLKWFAPNVSAQTIFPNLANFAQQDVGFMKLI